MPCSLLNPKALLFRSVLLPQFIDPHGAPVSSQMAELGSVLVLTGIAFDLACVVGASRLSSFLRHKSTRRTVSTLVFRGGVVWICNPNSVCLSS